MTRLTGRRTVLAATAAGLLWAEGVGAQSGRPWVDPPSQAETPAPEAAPAPARPEAPASPPAQPEAPAAPAQPRRVDPPAGDETRMPPSEPVPGPDQASPAPRAPSPAPPRAERPAPPVPAPETRPRQEEASPPRTSPRSAEPPRSEPEPPTVGERRPRASDFADAAQDFAAAYLAYWSAPNAITLDATPEFYAPQVLFHGRQMSARAVFEEKRRFVRRWPLRDYRPHPGTMRASCDAAPPICTVRTTFDFTAMNPRTGKRSQGTALLQLGVSFAAGEPMIVFESSQVTSRARSARSEAFEDAEDDRD